MAKFRYWLQAGIVEFTAFLCCILGLALLFCGIIFFGVDSAEKPTAKAAAVDTLRMERSSSGTTMKARPETLRKVVFWLGDVVWPKWCEDTTGRRIYLEYADGCADGEISVANAGFLDRAWPTVKRHLEVDRVQIEASD